MWFILLIRDVIYIINKGCDFYIINWNGTWYCDLYIIKVCDLHMENQLCTVLHCYGDLALLRWFGSVTYTHAT